MEYRTSRKPFLILRPLFSFHENVEVTLTVYANREGQWVQEGVSESFMWINDNQMSLKRFFLPNWNSLASLQTGEVMVKIQNSNTGETDSFNFFASSKVSKKAASGVIEKKLARHPIVNMENPMFDRTENIYDLDEKKMTLLDSVYSPMKEEEEDDAELHEPQKKKQRIYAEPIFEHEHYGDPHYGFYDKENIDLFHIEDLPLNILSEMPLDSLPPIETTTWNVGIPEFATWCFFNYGLFAYNRKKEEEDNQAFALMEAQA
eukprot:TRINITY_DN8230_c0_g1_i1.p1 TRINITY_DN8230_c0_g1~~TRINITY_DN8230_c0_g1_i1.p1  ORF type:complete len:261 (+),score=68.39 TRINITY_DN8230_c0_g1_i1:169-951(+)